MKKNKAFQAALLAFWAVLAVCGSSAVQASTPGERVVCATLPGQAWMDEERIKAVFGANEYLRADLKVSKTNCYEFYAIKKNGDIVEAYYHPVTGELVRRNVILYAPGAVSAPSATASAASVPTHAASAVSAPSHAASRAHPSHE
jgi:hypothetical protein